MAFPVAALDPGGSTIWVKATLLDTPGPGEAIEDYLEAALRQIQSGEPAPGPAVPLQVDFRTQARFASKRELL